MVLAQKYCDAPKMLNQASMLQHFLILTASNGSPLKALLGRGFAQGESSEQTGERAHREGKAGVSLGVLQLYLGDISALAQRSPARGGSGAKHERQGGRRSKSKFTWFSASGFMSALSEPCVSLSTLCLERVGERAVRFFFPTFDISCFRDYLLF